MVNIKHNYKRLDEELVAVQNGDDLIDNNLTGLVAISVIQTGWIPLINALTGPLSAVVGAGVALAASELTQRREEQKNRKRAYVNFIAAALVLGMNPHPNTASQDYAKSFAEIELFGSIDVINKIHEFNINPNLLWRDAERLNNELIPLMRNEL